MFFPNKNNIIILLSLFISTVFFTMGMAVVVGSSKEHQNTSVKVMNFLTDMFRINRTTHRPVVINSTTVELYLLDYTIAIDNGEKPNGTEELEKFSAKSTSVLQWFSNPVMLFSVLFGLCAFLLLYCIFRGIFNRMNPRNDLSSESCNDKAYLI